MAHSIDLTPETIRYYTTNSDYNSPLQLRSQTDQHPMPGLQAEERVFPLRAQRADLKAEAGGKPMTYCVKIYFEWHCLLTKKSNGLHLRLAADIMTPIEDFMYLLNSVLLGEEPTIEDFILLIGTCVAFIAFVLWCCFPIVPKEANAPMQYDSRSYNQYKKLDSNYEHST